MIFLLKLISLLPLGAMYLVSDALALLMYHGGYRKKVVFSNLHKAFPEYNPALIRKTARSFYKNLADIFVESLKGFTIPEKGIRKRVKPVNMELAEKYFDQGVSFVAMVSHMCNWEWVGLACSSYLRAENVVIYQQLASPTADEFMKRVRTRFGAVPIEKKSAYRNLVRRKNIISAIGVIADQSPQRGENKFWTSFLNQPSAFFSGGEKIARMFDFPVVYIIMKRIRRGYYEMHFETLAEPPYTLPENEILAGFVKKLERDIRAQPANWLWSHKRWKLKRTTDDEGRAESEGQNAEG